MAYDIWHGKNSKDSNLGANIVVKFEANFLAEPKYFSFQEFQQAKLF